MTTNTMTFSYRIRAAREHAGLTREELAARMGVTPGYVQLMERTNRGLCVDRQRALDAALADPEPEPPPPPPPKKLPF